MASKQPRTPSGSKTGSKARSKSGIRKPGAMTEESAIASMLGTTAATLANQFLVAMPALDDENFNHSVTLLCEHSEKGALGLIINRPLTLRLQEMLDQMGLPREQLSQDPNVYWGGPVMPERGFVVHSSPGGWDSSMPIADDLYITTSRDILAAIGRGEGPSHYFVALGYAGWGAGQLEDEVLRNSWLNTPVDRAILFQTPPTDRWRAATRLLGVDVSHLASEAGHA